LAKAAPDMNIGMEDLYPRMVVDGSHCLTGRRIRGWKKKREKEHAFSVVAVIWEVNGEGRRGIGVRTDFVVGCAGVVG
jgi:hypothetical protein